MPSDRETQSHRSRVEDYVRSLTSSDRMKREVAFFTLLPGTPAVFGETARAWPDPIRGVLDHLGIDRLYRHQADAIDRIRDGHSVAVATATASGKTLIYNLPVCERILADPGSRALYLYPLKALAQDQLKTLQRMAAALGDAAPSVAIYDGDTSSYRRRRIREAAPNILLTNPDMLHLSILAHHRSWKRFLTDLNMIVIDEAHTYRGIFGAHTANVFRRLRRICRHHGSDPAFVFCSATLANPAGLARGLTGVAPQIVESGSEGRGRRFVVFMDPVSGPSRTAIQLLHAALHRGLRTIVYTQSRKMTELIAMWAKERSGPYAERIAAYRAGFLPEERREIEAGLAGGDLLAVVSTSALELGIDIGDLDLCILVGYPGSAIATWQRGGRVGRSGQDSALVMIAGDDALDRYWLRHPEALLHKAPEAGVVNPTNRPVLEQQLICAAAELPLNLDEPLMAVPPVADAVRRLETRGDLLKSADGHAVYASRKAPHRDVNLRSTGDTYTIWSEETGRRIGEIDGFRVFRETHPGAIYLHAGRTHRVESVDTDRKRVRISAVEADYYTRVRADKDIRILETGAQNDFGRQRYCFGTIEVTDRVIGYEQRKTRTQELLAVVDLDVPPTVFETDAIWFSLASDTERAVRAAGADFWGGLHAVEHAAIGIFPLLVLADRNDLGGIATPFHAQLDAAAIFIYDGIPGGAGLCAEAFEKLPDLFRHTHSVIADCPCDDGCPACVQSPKCGNGNRPLDKIAATLILASLLSEMGDHPSVARPQKSKPILDYIENNYLQSNKINGISNYGVVDIETRRSAAEVGGWRRADRMRVSCAVLFDAASGEYLVFEEDQVPDLLAHMGRLDRVVGFNLKRFDYRVLSRYTDQDFTRLPTLDILEDVHRRLGFRLSLDHLAQETLGRKKTADGLQALRWWKEGRMQDIIDYCRMDVEITRDLYRFGLKHGYLLFRSKAGEPLRVPVSW